MFDKVAGCVIVRAARYAIVKPDVAAVPDILIPHEVIIAFGQTLTPRSRVVVGDVINIPGKGLRAARIIEATPFDEHAKWLVWLPCKPKWFNQKQGFGFLVLDGGEDVFVHKKTMRESVGSWSTAELEGRSLEVACVRTPKGLLALSVRFVIGAKK
jgi:cold shock CspA family protein